MEKFCENATTTTNNRYTLDREGKRDLSRITNVRCFLQQQQQRRRRFGKQFLGSVYLLLLLFLFTHYYYYYIDYIDIVIVVINKMYLNSVENEMKNNSKTNKRLTICLFKHFLSSNLKQNLYSKFKTFKKIGAFFQILQQKKLNSKLFCVVSKLLLENCS